MTIVLATVEVWRWRRQKNMVTVHVNWRDEAGFRLAGPKLLPGDADLVAKFTVRREAVENWLEEFNERTDA